ncbi:MAG: type II and III secretion system protein family protein, partial [Pseudomonadota bacterium]
VASPSIADVGVLRSNRLYVVGRAIGDTNVLAFDDAGNVLAEISVHVRIDEKTLKETIGSFFPDEEVTVKTVGDNIVLTGRVSTPAVANQVRDLTNRFSVNADEEIIDLMKVAGEQQVMLKVKIVEADRSTLRELGVDMDFNVGDIATDTVGGALDSISGTGLTAANPFAQGALFVSDNDNLGVLNLRALERDGLVNTLAEPNLTAISGESAGFLAGGEFPVPTGVDDQGRIQIVFKEFGVSLDFRPIVMSKDRISLQLAAEVSALAQQDSISLGEGVSIPGLTVRRANSTVEMGSGSSLMIAGLIQSETTNALNGLPGISDLPIIGDLFKSKSFARDESELLIIVSPYLVTSYAEAEAEAEVTTPDTDEKSGNALAERFQFTMNRAYSNRLPEDLETGPEFGYLID